jgi:hypothetical protein
MAINLITHPQNVPADLNDWQNNIKLIDSLLLQQEDPWRIDFDNDLVKQGSVFQIQGAIYQADADTAITGTSSNYVKITPAGATASAAYVANLTGVTWSNVYKGYYDASGNLYIFDEIKAIAGSVISAAETRIGRAYKSLLAADNDFTGANSFANITASGNVTVSGDITVAGNIYSKERFKVGPNVGVTYGDAYAAIDPFIPNTNDDIPVTGGQVNYGSPSYINIFMRAYRHTSGDIYLYYVRLAIGTGDSYGFFTLSSGSTTTFSGKFGIAG